MSSSASMNDKVSSKPFGLLSPFVYPKNRGGLYLDGPRSYANNVGSASTSLQSPFSSPTATRVCNASGSSRRLVEPSSECTQACSTSVRYHLPTRMRAIPKQEISCFESDDEDHEGHIRVKKALALASDALAWCTRRRANSAVSLKTRQSVVDEHWTRGRDPKSPTHKVQWSGSTLNSVTERYTSLVPVCREIRESTTLQRFGPSTGFGLGAKESKMEGGSSNSRWIGWHGSNPFEIEEVSWHSKLRSPGPPPTCPLPPLPTEAS
ncbi:hypothetical protein DFH28DRAFT_1097265 [Melampsora americana]|nr:hypothetical protein DFH28DRAFT_1097265 [Melampsora americana]